MYSLYLHNKWASAVRQDNEKVFDNTIDDAPLIGIIHINHMFNRP